MQKVWFCKPPIIIERLPHFGWYHSITSVGCLKFETEKCENREAIRLWVEG